MTHTMRLRAHPFDLIASGKKTVELRLFDEKRRAIRVGDTIAFTQEGDASRRLLCRVIALHVFSTFRDLYRALPLCACGYTEEEARTASHTDMAAYYSQEEQEKYSVVGIELRLLSEDTAE